MDHANSTHEAFIMLLLRHEAGIRAFIRTVVHRTEDVDEVMQAVSLVAWRARAIVPPAARGFTVVTRGVAYEDVGTEFGLSVDGATGASRMHVFDGQVNLRRGDAAGSLLRTAFGGDSVGFRDGQVEEISDMDVGAFPSPDDIGQLRWASQRMERLASPGLIAWFPFESGDNPSLLVNEARNHGLIEFNNVRQIVNMTRGRRLAVSPEDGALIWRHNRVADLGTPETTTAHGNSPVYADGMLYCLGENGNMGLLEANPAAFNMVSMFQLPKGEGPCWTHPVISGGKLYLRWSDTLYVYDTKE